MSLPQGDNRGRVFPYNITGPHYLGPAVIEGKVYRVAVWKNLTAEGKEFLRLIFEPSDDYETKEDQNGILDERHSDRT